MPPQAPASSSSTWILFSFLTVACWGVYGVYLHRGQTEMADMANGRWKAFLFVGFAYFLVAVIAPLIMLRLNGKPGDTNFLAYPMKGQMWSLIAGIVGAVGAFGVLLAFGAAPQPKAAYIPVVMSIIFAGAPITRLWSGTTMPPVTRAPAPFGNSRQPSRWRPSCSLAVWRRFLSWPASRDRRQSWS
jgi:hypothetical protein